MNLLIIGGTAYFGTDIVELALKAGHTVTICSRGNARPPFWDRVSHIAVDRTDAHAFSKALRGKSFDAVIDNITVDISKAQTQLGFQPTRLETWTATTCKWYRETEYSDDAPGYADREKETELAERFRA